MACRASPASLRGVWFRRLNVAKYWLLIGLGARDRCRAGGAPRGLLSVDQSRLLREAWPRQHVAKYWLLIGLGPSLSFTTYSRSLTAGYA